MDRRKYQIPCSYCKRMFTTALRQTVSKYRRGGKVYCSRKCEDLNKPRRPFIERFLSYVDQNGPVPEKRPDLGPCWIWLGAKRDGGYGQLRCNGKSRRTHQLAYEHYREPVPDGLELHHLCETQLCCNPWHLEAIPHKEHMRRHPDREPVTAARNRLKKECPQHHRYTPENTYTDKNGHRRCRTCNRIGAAAARRLGR
jgi:HNH endonuclease